MIRIVAPGFRPLDKTKVFIICAGCRENLVQQTQSGQALPLSCDCPCGYRTEAINWQYDAAAGTAYHSYAEPQQGEGMQLT